MENKKVVIITGAGRGIGAATAKLFAQKGYAICTNYKPQSEPAEKLAKEITALGVKCITVKADVSNENDVNRLFLTVDSELGTVTVLVNNAGILRPQSRLIDMKSARINEILINNVTSYFLCSREAVKRMSTTTGGSGGVIVNVSSGAAKSGSPNEYIDYAASKGAVAQVTKALANEWAAKGVNVNAIAPGFFPTELTRKVFENPELLAHNAGMTAIGRNGELSDLDGVTVFLASAAANYITGQIIAVDGGFTAK